ncbi:dihydropyrimidinase, variant [Thecamonas trahens ATCC 50062]|uniref:dihydropyrimidinase n=1 Tax=Thecamonas trahens ATCC 50062 TaxID=461836 RepID=A0A0L0DMP4_THETB|nr:dihydropyrimidinase, variant [Thecamonas trahens ATCC 50062]KNC53311.1 dihydropyrimidinase, variant [Thecamonas trahens ATCC 50062]|eukprot:XP_013754572.1 dihydropyrimidinase, variant [Thecamonas trahens ATCC 50062]
MADTTAPAPPLLISGGDVVNADQTFRADVLCVDGVIAAVGLDLDVPEGTQVVDATGLLVMPGGVDTHTHCRLPFMSTVAIDDFETGTRGALCGGTTSIIDFVIPSPGQSILAAFDQWQEWAADAQCDFGFHVAITWWSDQVEEEMGILTRERGVASFKHFLAYKGALMLDDEALYNSFTRAKELGALCTVHAENGEMVYRGQMKMLEAGITGPEGHPWSRPVECEAEATDRALRTGEFINTPVYIVHVSCKEAMDVVARAKAAGQVCYAEVLAGHATIDDSVYFQEDKRAAMHYVMSPPFRPAGNPDALINALAAGVADTTATDNCTFCTEQKSMGADDFTKIPNGTAGIEDRMSVLFDRMVVQGAIDVNKFVAVTSTNAARIFNMYPRKGVIAVGSDADICVMDPNAKRVISVNTHHVKVDFNPWEGREVTGVPAFTVCAGRLVWKAVIADGVADWAAGEFSGVKGSGRYIERPCFGLPFETVPVTDKLREKQPIQRAE